MLKALGTLGAGLVIVTAGPAVASVAISGAALFAAATTGIFLVGSYPLYKGARGLQSAIKARGDNAKAE